MTVAIDDFDLAAQVERDLGAPARRDGRGAWWCCPFHQDKNPSFLVSHRQGERARFFCFGCHANGDAVDYVRRRTHVGYKDALAMLGIDGGPAAMSAPRDVAAELCEPPCSAWQDRAAKFVLDSSLLMWDAGSAPAWEYLRGRGLSEETIRWAGFGFNSTDRWDDRSAWGLAPETDDKGRPRRVFLSRGVVIPWWIDNGLWNIRIRRFNDDIERAAARGVKLTRYTGPAGPGNGLYQASTIAAGAPVVMVEGEIDAVTLREAVGDLVAVVATGSAAGARRLRWVGRLALASRVLLAFDDDDAGRGACEYWSGVLPRARRWRAPWGDANAMHMAGADVRGWIMAGLQDSVV